MSKTGTNATIPPCVAGATHDEINTLTVRNLTDDQLIARTKEQLQRTKTSHGLPPGHGWLTHLRPRNR
jgi:hypothetical protein